MAVSTITAVARGDPVRLSTAEAVAAAFNTPMSAMFTIQDDDSRLSGKTILEHHRLISAVLAQADKELLVSYNAAQKATPPKAQTSDHDYYQPEEINQILKVLQDAPILWKTISYLLIDTCCRRGEIANLKWEKIHFETGIVVIDSSLLYSAKNGIYEASTKTKNFRALRLSSQSLDMLQKWRAECERMKAENKDHWVDTPYIFVRDNGEPIHPDSITYWLQ